MHIVVICQYQRPDASARQVQKLLADKNRHRSVSVHSQPNEARIASVRLIAGQTATLRTEHTRERIGTAWSGSRSSGVVSHDETIASGFAVTANPKGKEVEVTISPLHGTLDRARPPETMTRSGNTRLVVPLNKWVTVYSSARFDHAAYDQLSTLLKVSLAQ